MWSYKRALAGALVALAAAWSPAPTAHAGGMFLFDRGSRPLSRGGAFVAGADDPGALWYNPAGLDASGNQVLSDFTINFLRASFRRVDPEGGFEPKVQAKVPPLPTGTLAISHNFGLKDVTFGAGIFAPNAVLLNWPRSVTGADGTPQPAPQRYSLIKMNGSVLASGLLGFSYHGIKWLSLGANLQVTYGRFYAENALSAYDGVLCAYPEQGDCDIYSSFDAFPAYGISAGFGFKARVSENLTLGASAVLPYELKGRGALHIKRMATNRAFQDAYLSGGDVSIRIKFPTIVRMGAELRTGRYLRTELALVWEQWSRQQNIDVTPREPTFLRNVVGLDDYQVGDVHLERRMRDTWSARLGVEWEIPPSLVLPLFRGTKQTLRAGIAYERGAFSNSALTPLTIDSDKIVLATGNSFNLTKRLRLEGTIGYMFMADPRVRNSRIRPPSALRPPPNDPPALGNGNYELGSLFIGGGFSVNLD